MMSMRPSGKSSATSAATLEVPMSKATMRFLFSLAMSGSLARAGLGPGDIGDAQGKAIGIAQVDVVETLPGLPKVLRVYGDELCKTALDAVLVRVVSELHREPIGELDLPGQSGAQIGRASCRERV